MHSVPIQAAFPWFAPSPLLSRTDLSDDEVAKDCIYELQRCGDDIQFARWARRWGPAITVRLRATDEVSSQAEEDLEEAEERIESLQSQAATMRETIRRAVKALDAAMKDVPNDIAQKVFNVTSSLEAAL